MHKYKIDFCAYFQSKISACAKFVSYIVSYIYYFGWYFIISTHILAFQGIKKTAYLRHLTQTSGFVLVEVTGLEPTASASRTQRSTKLSHTSKYHCNIISHPSNLVKAFFSVLYPLCFFYCVDLWCMTNLLKSFPL